MAGLNFKVGAGLNGLYGGGASPATSATAAAYGPAAAPASDYSILNPFHPHGAGFYARLGIIVVTLAAYHSLPR